MKNFTPKIEGKLIWFLEKGDEIAVRTARFSAGRSNISRNDNVRNCLAQEILEHGGINTTFHYFGSRVSGTSVGRSDLDFFAEVGDNFMVPNSKEDAAQVLKKIKNALNKSHWWKVVIYLPDAAVPLLRVTYLKTDYECDIVATSGKSVCLSHILNHLNSIQPQIIPLFHYIRIWLHLCGINMKRYVQYLLIFFYLEQDSFMPTMQRVQHNLPKKFVDDCEVQYDPSRTLSAYQTKRMRSYENHILGYFQFYSKVDFGGSVLSLYTGDLIERTDYNGYESYKIEKPLCIAGPLECGFNSGQTVGKNTIAKFSKVCQLSCEFLNRKGWK